MKAGSGGGDELITETGLFGRFIREAQAIEQSSPGLSAGMFIGNPFTDVPELGCDSFVVTNNDPALADAVSGLAGGHELQDLLACECHD